MAAGPVTVKCAMCHGFGKSDGGAPCPSCGGTGGVVVYPDPAGNPAKCGFCVGTGRKGSDIPCQACKGTGWAGLIGSN